MIAVLYESLHHADIAAGEVQILILPQQPGKHALGIALFDFRMGEIGTDDAGFACVIAGVDEVIQAGCRELVGQLCAEVVQNQQIAGKIAVCLTLLDAGVVGAVEALVLKVAEDILCRFVQDIVPAVNERFGDCVVIMRLPSPVCPKNSRFFAFSSENASTYCRTTVRMFSILRRSAGS